VSIKFQLFSISSPASGIPGAEIVIFPDAGHMLLKAGDEMSMITLDFLQRHAIKKYLTSTYPILIIKRNPHLI
jgi:hypothetical protein